MYWINIEKIGYISKISDIFDFFDIFDFLEKIMIFSIPGRQCHHSCISTGHSIACHHSTYRTRTGDWTYLFLTSAKQDRHCSICWEDYQTTVDKLLGNFQKNLNFGKRNNTFRFWHTSGSKMHKFHCTLLLNGITSECSNRKTVAKPATAKQILNKV